MYVSCSVADATNLPLRFAVNLSELGVLSSGRAFAFNLTCSPGDIQLRTFTFRIADMFTLTVLGWNN